MEIDFNQDFSELRKQFGAWRKRFPMFVHDVKQIETIVEQHIQNFAIAGIHYRQTHSKSYLEKAQHELDEIKRVVAMVEKIELMAMLSR
jgi:hypothetical protein